MFATFMSWWERLEGWLDGEKLGGSDEGDQLKTNQGDWHVIAM